VDLVYFFSFFFALSFW